MKKLILTFCVCVLCCILLYVSISIVNSDDGNDKKSILENHAQLMRNFMNESINPCDDFYEYACGNWAKFQRFENNEDSSSVTEILISKVNKFLKEVILEKNSILVHSEKVKKILSNDLVKKAQNYYDLCKEQNGPQFEQYLAAWNIPGGWPALNSSWDAKYFDWLNITAHLKLLDLPVFFDAKVLSHYRNTSRNAIYILKAEFPLFQPKSYFNSSIKTIMLDLITYPLVEMNVDLDEATQIAIAVLEFETELAKIYPEEESDTEDLEKLMTEIEKEFLSDIDFDRYLDIISNGTINKSENLVITDRKYLTDIANLLNETSPRVLANFLLYRFTLKIVTTIDIIEMKEFCMNEVIENMGSILGYIYNQAFNDEKSNSDIHEIFETVKSAFRETIKEADWIDNETNVEAQMKIKNLIPTIGTPNQLLTSNYLNENLFNWDFDSSDYYKNFFKLHAYTARKPFETLNRTNYRTEWNYNPVIVNAYYDSVRNNILIPTNILQMPVYHYKFPKSVKYGALGSIIGHEITHSLDKSRRTIDSNAMIRNWWSNNSLEEYISRAECIEHQYNNFTPSIFNLSLEDNLNENIADNGGTRQSYRAYKKWLDENKGMDEKLPGLNMTNTQLFFLSFAQFYCENVEPVSEFAVTDEHSIGRFRVIGTLSNFEEFSKEFQCEIGTLMNPEKKCRVW